MQRRDALRRRISKNLYQLINANFELRASNFETKKRPAQFQTKQAFP